MNARTMIQTPLPITCLLTAGLLLTSVAAGDEPVPVPVRAGSITQSQMPAGRVFVGTIEPARRSTIGSPVAGRVEQVFAEEGDAVDPEDQHQGRIVQLELTTVGIELAAAEADRDVAFHELEELIKGPRKEEIARREAEVKRAGAQLENLTERFNRIKSLFDRGAAGQSDLDAARSARVSIEQALVIAEQLFQEGTQGTRPEQLAQAQARLARAEEEVRKFQTRMKEHTIRTPFEGFVVTRPVQKGAWIQQGDPIAEVIELNPVELRVSVPEKYVSRLRLNTHVAVEIDAITSIDGHSGQLTGTVYRVIPDADSRTRSFPVRIRLDNSTNDGLPLIQPGMLARVTLPVGPGEDALLVPRDALVLDGTQTSVFVVDSGEDAAAVREVQVTPGGARGNLIQITPRPSTALSAGMQVITEGNESLRPGQTVNLLEDTVSGP